MARRGVLALGILSSIVHGNFYSEGHFDRVEKVTDYGMFLDYIDEQIENDKTVFAPSWNDVTRMFEGNSDVAFADINLSKSPMLKGEELGSPGSGGWPTIRYFNKKTGQFGDAYKKLTNFPMCQELGDRMRMIDYVEDYGNTVLCGLDGKNCNEKEAGYLEKWKAKPMEEMKSQITRLEDMRSKPMNDDLMEWALRRIRILQRIIAGSATVDAEL